MDFPTQEKRSMQQTHAARPSLWKLFVRLQNPMMKWLLASPLHFIVSNHYLLITFTGCKSGHEYTTPVQYAQAGNDLLIITSAIYIWWRNLRGGAPVTIRLRGQTWSGAAETSTAPGVIAENFRAIYPRASEDWLARMLSECVAIRIHLERPVAE